MKHWKRDLRDQDLDFSDRRYGRKDAASNECASDLMTAGVVAVARDHSEMMRAVRERIKQLNITLESLEESAGLPSRYAPKILGTVPIRRVTPHTIHLMLQALGLEIHLVESPELMEKYTNKLAKIRNRQPMQGRCA